MLFRSYDDRRDEPYEIFRISRPLACALPVILGLGPSSHDENGVFPERWKSANESGMLQSFELGRYFEMNE